VFNTANR